jgi:hypothetical protein
MTDQEDALHDYVRAALTLQGYAFSDERVAEITVQFARIAAIAETLPAAAPTEGDIGAAPGGRLPAAPVAGGPAPVFRP